MTGAALPQGNRHTISTITEVSHLPASRGEGARRISLFRVQLCKVDSRASLFAAAALDTQQSPLFCMSCIYVHNAFQDFQHPFAFKSKTASLSWCGLLTA